MRVILQRNGMRSSGAISEGGGNLRAWFSNLRGVCQ
jgi:hypothetical protein